MNESSGRDPSTVYAFAAYLAWHWGTPGIITADGDSARYLARYAGHFQLVDASANDVSAFSLDVIGASAFVYCAAEEVHSEADLGRIRAFADAARVSAIAGVDPNRLSAAGSNVVFSGLAGASSGRAAKSVKLCVLENASPSRLETLDAVPEDFRVTAIMTAYNEEDIIESSIEYLISQGIDVYLIDNHSTDRTREIAERFLDGGLVGLESFPASGPTATYDWRGLLKRVEEVSRSLGPGWYIHHDADQVRESPWPEVSMREGIYRADQAGFDCINHVELVFHPVDDGFRAGSSPRDYFRYFELPSHPMKLVQLSTWKNRGQPYSLADTGGHEIVFEGQRMYPYRFLLRHYPVRSQAHGVKKVFGERRPRWNPEERAAGWHVQYDPMEPGHSFLRSPDSLVLFEAETFYEEFLIERVSGVGLGLI